VAQAILRPSVWGALAPMLAMVQCAGRIASTSDIAGIDDGGPGWVEAASSSEAAAPFDASDTGPPVGIGDGSAAPSDGGPDRDESSIAGQDASDATIATASDGAAMEASVNDAAFQSDVVPPTVVELTAGIMHACALLADGTVACWGDNEYSELGDGTDASGSATPVIVAGLSGVTSVSAGHLQTCTGLSDGGAVCWGENASGDLGANTPYEWQITPVAVSALSGVVTVAAGYDDTCALLTDGGVVCWGNNEQGQLGSGTSASYSVTPVNVPGVSPATSLGLANGTVCAVLAEGTVDCWGGNGMGELGTGAYGLDPTPTPVPGITNAISVSGGLGVNECVLLDGGTVDCWGAGFSRSVPGSPTPLAVPGVGGLTAIAAGEEHVCGLLPSGAVVCWGSYAVASNDGGFDGVDPTIVPGLTDAIALAAGKGFTCAIRSNGTVVCWGVDQPMATASPCGLAGCSLTPTALLW